jgi:flagellar biosynthesis protein FlhF
MNVKRFTARTSREAMQKVRQAFGDHAVVLSNKPCPEGVEILAMPPESIDVIERLGTGRSSGSASAPSGAAAPRASGSSGASASRPAPAAARPARSAAPAAPAAAPRRMPEAEVTEDVSQLAMSTLSFQDYVRERMLKRREEAMRTRAEQAREPAAPVPPTASAIEERLAQRRRVASQGVVSALIDEPAPQPEPASMQAPLPAPAPVAAARPRHAPPPPVLHDELRPAQVPALAEDRAARQERTEMMNELRSMKGLIEERFGALAFMEKLQRQPKHALVTGKLLDCGFSPVLIRKLVDGMGADVGDEMAWTADVLERNLLVDDAAGNIEDQGGVYALMGATGVGKTTTTAKIAANFAAKHGAGQLGLITLDAYRLGAHEQLRAYGRILGVPVHTAHDRTALEDLLDLLSAKKMVLIDTAGLAQRDTRTKELLDMLSHRAINRLLVLNAASQGETLEDVLVAYRAEQARGIVLTKLDEAVKLGPSLDAVIRHRLPVVGVANGQRVPEDWHHLSASALVHRALRGGGGPAYRMDSNEVSLVFAGGPAAARRPGNGRSAAAQ